ncbi:PH domain-like protein [Hypoxylon sp. NC1633]|nr:PH domain-like protein [Hypoxylon sp. NC1633]
MSQSIPRKSQSRGGQAYQGHPPAAYSHSPHSNSHTHFHAHTYTHTHTEQHNHHHQQLQQQHQQQQQFQQSHHSRNRSQQLRAQAVAEQQQQLHLSDYESDTARYMASHPPPPAAALAARTNTELNLRVLRRYRPTITSVLAIAANAVVYVFTPPDKWEKSHLEGTLFICAQQQEQQQQHDESRDDDDEDNESEDRTPETDNVCLFVLNRKGLQNLILDLNTVLDFELSDGLLIFKFPEDETTLPLIPMENSESVRPGVLGMWFYAEDDEDRRVNEALIYELWSKARAARQQNQDQEASSDNQTTNSSSPSDGVGITPAMQETGRPVSLAELFGRGMNGIGNE